VANILTAAEAATVLRTVDTDQNMLDLLPQVDAYIQNATGRDWTQDNPIRPEVKSAARMLLTMWYENPAMLASGISSLSHGLAAALVQLEALGLRYKTFHGRDGAGACELPESQVGDLVESLMGVSGVSGDQSTAFESVISVAGQIQQVSTDDLSTNWYRAYLVPIEAQWS
jgi:hypothetical protein